MKEVEESPLIDDKWKLIYIRMSHRILQMEWCSNLDILDNLVD